MKTFKLSYSDKIKSGLKFRPLAQKCCCAVLRNADFIATTTHTHLSYEASLTLTSDEEIRSLNHQYRGIDSVTDVLSFEMGEMNHETDAMVLGDIIVSVPTAIRQAAEYGHSVEREMAFLTVHGMLHLLGYDHINAEDESIMFAKQEQILQKIGISR